LLINGKNRCFHLVRLNSVYQISSSSTSFFLLEDLADETLSGVFVMFLSLSVAIFFVTALPELFFEEVVLIPNNSLPGSVAGPLAAMDLRVALRFVVVVLREGVAVCFLVAVFFAVEVPEVLFADPAVVVFAVAALVRLAVFVAVAFGAADPDFDAVVRLPVALVAAWDFVAVFFAVALV